MNEKQVKVVNDLIQNGWRFDNHNTEWQRLLSELTVTLTRSKNSISVDGRGNTRTQKDWSTLLRKEDINHTGNERSYVSEFRKSKNNAILESVYLPSYITTGY